MRGNSSSRFKKKSFAVDLEGADGKKLEFPFLGMPADDEWILYGGGEIDPTLGMRNFLAMSLGRASGQYASRTVFAETFIADDGRPLSTDHYYGLHLGMEKIKRGAHRVDIQKLEPPNPSGGYIWVYDNDNIEPKDVTFGPADDWDLPFQIKYPSSSKATPEDLSWLLDYINDMQAALNAPDWLTATPSYTSLIDGPNWVDYFLLVELTKNPDGYRGSTYMHKDRDGPMRMGPAWDYNEAFGLCCGFPIEGYEQLGESGPGVSGGSAISPEGFRFNICEDRERCVVEPGDGVSRWFRRMWQDPRYRQAAATRWTELRAGPWSDPVIASLVDTTADEISEAALRNYAAFADVLEKPWYEGAEVQWTTEVRNLRSWTLAHVQWMDEALPREAGGGGGSPVAEGAVGAGPHPVLPDVTAASAP